MLFFMYLFSCIACSEFIEPSLKDKTVKLLAPADSSESGVYLQNFWWEAVDHASSYRVQIVTPSFDHAIRLIVDTLVKKEQFAVTLEPGDYQWRVRAENGSSHSEYASASFSIKLSAIKNQEAQLDNTLTNLQEVLLSWEQMFAATRYTLQVDTANFEDENKLVFNSSTPNKEYSFTFSGEKTYRWRVRAENDTAQSRWSAIYKITYDKTPPPAVSLLSPAANQVISKPVSLQWQAAEGAKRYELLVLKNDSVTLVPNFPFSLTATSYTFNSGDFNEKFYWKVRAIDAAGNEGTYSAVRSFIVQ
jgi:hypothetical protein